MNKHTDFRIKYKNNKGKFVGLQQVSSRLKKYEKLFYENDLLIKEESYYRRKLIGVKYYNRNNQTHETILDTHEYHDHAQSNLKFCIIDNINYDNGSALEKLGPPSTLAKDSPLIDYYTIRNFYYYHRGILSNQYTKSIYDNLEREITSTDFDIDNNLITPPSSKIYYLSGKPIYYDYEDDGKNYPEDIYITFNFEESDIEIDTTIFDGDDVYRSVERFTKDWQGRLPYMTASTLEYFTNRFPLIPGMIL